jgi:MYXO-CTERM domain-containing protein
VLGQRGAGASARVWRRTGLAGVVVCAATGIAAASALADQRPQPDPSELWLAYPLEQKPTTVAKSPSFTPAGPRSAQKLPSSSANEGSDRPPRAVIAAVGAAAALLAMAVIALRRKRRRPAAPAPSRAAPRAAPVPAAPAAAHTVRVATAAIQPAVEPAPPSPAPAARPRTGQRAGAVRKAMTCQIRWNPRGRSFYAVSIDANGIEHVLASSARLEEAGQAPPDETPEARAALRHLAKELRDRGWRPLRAKGIDFEERRWYARRFRWPAEEELAAAGHADAGEVDEQISGRSTAGR